MSMPWAFERSPFRCARDGKALAMQMGQNADSGEVEFHHFCLSCGYVHVDRHAESVAAVRMTPAQILERRIALFDRPEVMSRYPGLADLVEEWFVSREHADV